MTTKGFAGNQTNIETPNDIGMTEKPLKSERSTSNRVDINVLKSKLEAKESKEFKAQDKYKDVNKILGEILCSQGFCPVN